MAHVADGVDGLMVPVKDTDAMAVAIIKLLNDRPLRKKMAEAERRRADDFRAEKIAAEYEKTFLKSMTQKRQIWKKS